jgi:glycosyltransferase involved in cell wall biosynthesis
MPSVLIIQEHLPAFRAPFYQRLRSQLESRGIDLKLVFAPNQRNTFLKGQLDWATAVPIRWLGPLAWQPVLHHARKADLVIVQQESKYAVNPLLQLLAKCGGTPVAYWGHGRNFQSPGSSALTACFKNFLATKVHWWFAYNDLSARVVRDLGFPEDRITSVGNAIDTAGLIERKNSLTPQELASVRAELGLISENVAVYTGGLYPNKRIKFLLDAAILIRAAIPDFELIVIGDGPDRDRVSAAASIHPWIHDVGPKNDKDKVPYWALAKLLLMPGLVGLVVVDSFALGVPLVTTDFPYHSPEIDYLKNGINGLLIPCGQSTENYASAVTELLAEPARLERLRNGALASASTHTVENMANNFAAGIIQAIKQTHV